MSTLYVDFNKLIGSIDTIQELNDGSGDSTKLVVSKCVNSIQDVGDKHDGCFSGLSDTNINNSVDDVSDNLVVLTDDIYTTINVVSNYANSSTDNVLDSEMTINNIKMVGLQSALEWNLNNASSLSTLISDNYIEAGYDYEYYNSLLKDLQSTCSTTREKSAASALFLATAFPRLPYFWGGGHSYNQEGCDPSWGTSQLVTAKGDDTTGTYQPYSIDCSGFVDWALYNGGVTSGAESCDNCTWDYENYGTKESISAEGVFNRVETGDLAYMDGHIGMIVGKSDGCITVAHCSGTGNGMNLTKIDTSTGLVVDDAEASQHVGTTYFTDVIELDY